MSELIRAFSTLQQIAEYVREGTEVARSSDHDRDQAYKDMFEALEEIDDLVCTRIKDLYGKPGDTP